MVQYQQRIVCRLILNLSIAYCFFNISGCNSFNSDVELLPYYNSQDLTPRWDGNNRHHISHFNLTDQTGTFINSDSLNDKIYIASFFFTTCPSICPKMTSCFKVLQDSISVMQDVEILSFSVMPEIDSVGRLRAYGQDNGINPVIWHLLTGKTSEIYSIGRSSFFADDNPSTDTTSFLHTDKMYLVDGHQQIRGVYNATKMDDVHRVLHDLTVLKKENK